MNEREQLLSAAVDALTAALELEDDDRLRQALELIMDVAMPSQSTS